MWWSSLLLLLAGLLSGGWWGVLAQSASSSSSSPAAAAAATADDSEVWSRSTRPIGPYPGNGMLFGVESSFGDRKLRQRDRVYYDSGGGGGEEAGSAAEDEIRRRAWITELRLKSRLMEARQRRSRLRHRRHLEIPRPPSSSETWKSLRRDALFQPVAASSPPGDRQLAVRPASSGSVAQPYANQTSPLTGPRWIDSGSRVARSLGNAGSGNKQHQRARNRTRSDSPREQRRRCRARNNCRGRNWCPDMDVGNRAFLAPTVFEGKARSMSSLRKPGSNYAVTFEVRQVYKSQPGFLPLQKNDSVRLHFRDKTVPGKSTVCGQEAPAAGQRPHQQQQQQQQKDRDNLSAGVVRANIKRGKVYLVFVNRVGPRNFTILGEPVIRSKKNEQAVQAVIRPDYVREVTLSELRDSVARYRDRVKLVCRTRGSPPPRVHWLKDGVPLLPRRGLRIQHKRRRSKVVISSARPEDSGRYECVAESTSGHRASLAAQLLVAHDTRIPETTTAAWLRQEQPCPIAGDFCMNGGTCLFFETVGEPACRCAEGFTGLRCETKDVISTGSVYNRHRAPFSCKLGLSTSYYC